MKVSCLGYHSDCSDPYSAKVSAEPPQCKCRTTHLKVSIVALPFCLGAGEPTAASLSFSAPVMMKFGIVLIVNELMAIVLMS